jgi:DNA-binding MarR family transcriptional regulator
MRPRSRTLHILERLCRLAREADEASSISALDVTHRELVLLEAVQNGAGTFRQLAALDGVSRASIRAVVERLEARRLTRRVRVVGTSAHEIELTTAGKDAIAAHAVLDGACDEALVRRLGPDVKSALAALERTLVERGFLSSHAPIQPVPPPNPSPKTNGKSGQGKNGTREEAKA